MLGDFFSFSLFTRPAHLLNLKFANHRAPLSVTPSIDTIQSGQVVVDLGRNRTLKVVCLITNDDLAPMPLYMVQGWVVHVNLEKDLLTLK